jgi:amidase
VVDTPADLCSAGAVELAAAMRAGAVSAREVTEAHLTRIDAVNGVVNAIVTLCPESARARAAAADRALSRGESLGALHGLPMAHKDLEDTAGVRTTYGSLLFADHIPTQDSMLIGRLRRAGAICVGKTNTPEFGTGSHTYNRVFGVTRNPYDPARSAGGSSGGAAAALAARLVPLADGSDMGGSLRNPASFCNVVGLRPSAGRVPSGDTWSTLSVSGPMARTVEDLALLLSVMAVDDPLSPIGLPGDGSEFRRSLDRDLRGTRVAWSPGLPGLRYEKNIVETLQRCLLPALETLGCVVSEAVPDLSEAEEVFRVLRAWEYSRDTEPLRRRDLVEPNVIWNIEEGLSIQPDTLRRAEEKRRALYQRAAGFMSHYDVLALPVTQALPFPVEQNWVTEIEGQAQDTYLDWMRSLYWVSATGLPAMSLPCGFSDGGLPVGVQLVGRPRGERALLEFAAGLQAANPVWQRRPDLP